MLADVHRATLLSAAASKMHPVDDAVESVQDAAEERLQAGAPPATMGFSDANLTEKRAIQQTQRNEDDLPQ